MNSKYQSKGSVIFLLTATIMFSLILATPALAQCGDTPDASSCITCHEKEAVNPVVENGEWHMIHASKDCCWNCHGGNTMAQDKDLAHEGMTTQPLSDTYTDCYTCHPNDYNERAERFAAALGVTISSPSTPVPHNTGDRVTHPMIIDESPILQKSVAQPGILLGAVLIAITAVLLGIAMTVLCKRPVVGA